MNARKPIAGRDRWRPQHLMFRDQRGRRGSILLLAIFFMILLSLLAVAFIKLVPAELQAATRHQIDTAAYYACDAGVVDTLAFLQEHTENGTVDTDLSWSGGQLAPPRTGTLGEWSWTCRVFPDELTWGSESGLAPNPLRAYRLECTASLNGKDYREVSVWIKQRSFAPAYGVDFLPADIYLNLATFRLEHDYMTNGRLLLYNPNDLDWQIGDSDMLPSFEKKVIFGEPVSHSTLGNVDGAEYRFWTFGDPDDPDDEGGLPYDEFGNQIPSRYARIARDGRDAFQVPSEGEAFSMPESSDNVGDLAYGGAAPSSALGFGDPTSVFGASGTVNAHIPATADLNAGIYIEGDVSRIDFRIEGGQLVDVLDGTSAAWNPSHPDWAQGAGMIQPEGNLVQGGHQVAEVRQGSDRMDVVFVDDPTKPLVIPAGATVNGSVLTTPLTIDSDDNGGLGYTLMRDASSSASQVRYDGSVTLPSGTYELRNHQSNGIIYATGDINGLRGIVKDRRTVAVSTDTGSSQTNDHEIRVNGHITLADTPPWSQQDTDNDPSPSTPWAVPGYEGMSGQDGHPYGDRPADTLSQFGMIGYAIRVAGAQASGPDQSGMWPNRDDTDEDSPLYIYASIFSGRADDPLQNNALYNDTVQMTQGGGFGVENSGSGDGGLGLGRMEIFGSIVEGVRQRKGTIGVSGHNYSYFYDTSLLESNPPGFPSLPVYTVLSWVEKSTFNY